MPGTDPAPPARGSGGANVLLCPASFIPRKGHRDLLQALAGLTELPWSLVCAGKMDADPACAAEARALCHALALSQRVSLRDQVGESELARLYDGTDLLVLASHYEGFGMVVQEATARGIPVITTTGGALKETLPPGAGLASAPGDVAALQENLRRVLSDRALYLTLAEGARRARRSQPTWQDAAAAFDAALRDLA
jgi:glycosyltransferase involved in cell wall biosynthesis